MAETIDVDFLRRDECQPMETAQMESAKAQIRPRNRANVNIVPYEIYDEDGVEQVVGEVRKTIDGVKKKKPLYSKMWTQLNQSIVPNAPTTISNLGTLPQIDYIHNSLIETNSNTWIQVFYPRIDFNKSENYIRVESKESITLNVLLLQYTKTTDEWEEV